MQFIGLMPRHFGATILLTSAAANVGKEPAKIRRAWVPWILLSVFVFVWGLPKARNALDGISAPKIEIAGLHNVILRNEPRLIDHPRVLTVARWSPQLDRDVGRIH